MLAEEGIGSIAFSPLAQGMLTDRYLHGIPADSRASKPNSFLKAEHVTEDVLNNVRQLNEVAKQRGQSLAQMALAWVLRGGRVTSSVSKKTFASKAISIAVSLYFIAVATPPLIASVGRSSPWSPSCVRGS